MAGCRGIHSDPLCHPCLAFTPVVLHQGKPRGRACTVIRHTSCHVWRTYVPTPHNVHSIVFCPPLCTGSGVWELCHNPHTVCAFVQELALRVRPNGCSYWPSSATAVQPVPTVLYPSIRRADATCHFSAPCRPSTASYLVSHPGQGSGTGPRADRTLELESSADTTADRTIIGLCPPYCIRPGALCCESRGCYAQRRSLDVFHGFGWDSRFPLRELPSYCAGSIGVGLYVSPLSAGSKS